MEWTWNGGANVPTIGGARVNASTGLARMVVRDDHVELGLRGRLTGLSRADPLIASPRDLVSVWPISRDGVWKYIAFRGVGFRRVDGREYYFKTTRTQEILRVLQYAGFPVTWQVGTATKIWKGVA